MARQARVMNRSIVIAIPFFKRREYLRRAIESVLRQSMPDWQLLVCDDCSPEQVAAELSREFHDERIRYHRNSTNLGLPGNWNRCLELADAELVTLLHDDDELLPGYCEFMLDAAHKYPAAAAFHCGASVMNDQGAAMVSAPDLFKRLLTIGHPSTTIWQGERALQSLLRGNIVYCPTVCYRKAVIGGMRFSNQWKHVPDLEFIARMLLGGLTLVGFKSIQYAYRRHAGSVTSHGVQTLERFDEESRLFDVIASSCTQRGWQRAAKTARSKRITMLQLLYQGVVNLVRCRPRQAWECARKLRKL
jgi:glycosyltransferase involved in cell wall biosynthesis